MFTFIFNNLNGLRMAYGLLWLTCIARRAPKNGWSLLKHCDAVQHVSGYLGRPCCAIKFAASTAGIVTAMANVIDYYVARNSANRAENGFRPSSAEMSSLAETSKHDVQMQRLKHVPGKAAASQAGLGNCQE
jgi:hypothetical protein